MPEYQSINDEVFTVSDFFTLEECEQHIALAESIGFDEAQERNPARRPGSLARRTFISGRAGGS